MSQVISTFLESKILISNIHYNDFLKSNLQPNYN